MNRIQNMEKAVFGATGSSTDANRLYSILLDTRASSVSENMYDIAEKLMKNEKENAKNALELFWSLKKNLNDGAMSDTVEMLINFYQEKLDVLRSKEEHIRKISKDSRELLEEKRKRDSEIAIVKQEVDECSKEAERLNTKMKELEIKEQELSLIGSQVKKELQLNANEVVNGLYEIILSSQEHIDDGFSVDNELKNNTTEETDTENDLDRLHDGLEVSSEVYETQVITPEEVQKTGEKKQGLVNDDTDIYENYSAVLKKGKVEPVVSFPKSVVKTTRGVVIGEYYYDSSVYKNKRHYIFNSDFFRIHLANAVNALSNKFDKTHFGEAKQIIEDANKRISEKSSLHFEVSTNEILNTEALNGLMQKILQKKYTDILAHCGRLNAKIEALGNNYIEMLKEQMARYSEN